LDEQRRIEQGARSPTNRLGGIKNDLPALSARERQLEQSLHDFQQQHPNLFKDSGQELDQARQSMEQAANEMQKRSANSQSAAAQATKDLQNLSSSMNGGSATQQLADAYRLKQMLDNDIRKLGDFSGAPSNNIQKIDPAQTARDARETVNQLKAAAEQEPTRDAFGQPLREALSGTNKVNIDAKLAQLEQAQDQPLQQQRAGEARDELSRVSKAFGESEPKSLQMARKSDSLKPDAKDSFNLGLSQLDSLAKQLGKDQKLSPQDQGKQGREALYNLQTGMRSLNGDNERGNQIMLHLEDMLKSKDPIEVEDLRKLLSELQHFSVESSDHLAKRDDPEVTNIDPAKLPPAYRGRIQKYFQKLSEK
jgi:exonuclease VII small subunit